MHLPILKKENRYRRSIVAFGGINRTDYFSEGELREGEGISHKKFPFITQRNKRVKEFECNMPTSAIFGENECVATEEALYYNRKKVGDLSPGAKQLAMLGNRIIVFPDKKYYDVETDEFKSLGAERCTEGAKVTFKTNSISVDENYFVYEESEETLSFPQDYMMVTYEKVSVSSGNPVLSGFVLKSPEEITEGAIVFEKCKKNQYRLAETVTYSEENRCYEVQTILITARNVTKDFFADIQQGDVVEIKGCMSLAENNTTATVLSKTETTLTFGEGTFIEGSETESITVGRKIPDFTCICTYENRLWGCEGNTIYASALGDAMTFFTYKGISTDSYSIQSNTLGEFTACIPFGNSCFFFKEASCYKLYGNRPANFTLNECFGAGILKGDSGSIVEVGGRLIYKGNGGIYSFSGGIPVRISDKLGVEKMENAVAATDGRHYYISADTESGREEFIWDTEKNLWCKSGVTDILGYTSYGEKVFCLKPDGVEAVSTETDSNTAWSITLCPFDEKYYNTKNYSRLRIKVQLFEGADINVDVKFDERDWENIGRFYGDCKKYLNIPCVVKSCNEFSIRLYGKGECVLESLVREYSIN